MAQSKVNIFAIITMILSILLIAFLIASAIYFYNHSQDDNTNSNDRNYGNALFWLSIVFIFAFIGLLIYAIIEIYLRIANASKKTDMNVYKTEDYEYQKRRPKYPEEDYRSAPERYVNRAPPERYVNNRVYDDGMLKYKNEPISKTELKYLENPAPNVLSEIPKPPAEKAAVLNLSSAFD